MSQASPITLMALEKAQGLQAKIFTRINEPSDTLHHFLKVLALSPTALSSYTELQTVNHNGSLDNLTGLRIALTLAALNQCQTSLALHTQNAREAGLNSSEIDSNRAGTSQDAKGAVAVQFARHLAKLSCNNPKVSEEQWQDIRCAGYSDADILEIISHVGMNLLGNAVEQASEIKSDLLPVSLNKTAKLNGFNKSNELIEAPNTA